ncbi:ubiquinone/menaquinone biosynthesis methyltransferase [Actinomadura alba]|uniref:Ubiquinone/menaquinone biosynthesis methyltransferase n=1 Tax=Actinomadura alba TaxID=406431 RepID=A0ABR7LU24_9ACTN|nr:ubiquinone/menaquinone biosynthesis methyltransferase [Actinomadura alba]MBC6468346.1 ubiquinone/menaquinone biosynthesis methyltransferase [Actinomadura alba]
MTTSAPSAPPVPLTARGFVALPPTEQVAAIRTRGGAASLGTTLRLVITLGRPRTCVPGLVAYAIGLGYAPAPVPVGHAVLGAVLALLVGFSANLHNTYTDVEEDSRNLPGRMWLLYRLGLRRLAWTLAGLNAFMVGAAVVFGPGFVVFTVIGLIGLHQYSFRPLRLKARPLLGLYVFAQAVVGPFLIGWFIGQDGVRGLPGPVWGMFGFLFAWFVAKGLVKNVPDFDGDHAAGLRTSATLFPTRTAAARCAALVTVAAYLCLPVPVVVGASPMAVLWALPWSLVAAYQGVRLVRAEDAAAANAVLRGDMVLSSAFLATVLLLQEPRWSSVAVIAAGALIIAASDLLAMDSRRDADTGSMPTREEPIAMNPPTGTSARPATPQELFDRIAPRYDLFNSLLSAGSDRRWRREVARRLAAPPGADVLDVATGTGSLAIAVARHRPDARIVACDINASMLAVAARRLERQGLSGRITLKSAPGELLPFPDASFDAVCIAFAIDDMADRRACAAEMARVLRPGGHLVLLELGVPEQPVLRSLYLGGLGVMSLLGRARGMSGYRHLREEIITYRGPEAVRSLLMDAGLTEYTRTPLTGGIAVVHAAVREKG